MDWAALAGPFAGLFGGGIDTAVSAKIAAQNRKFQERMYKHRYQYQMEDMRAAGLNPILAFGQSPPGAPTGAMPSAQTPFASGIGASAQWAARQLARQQAQTEKDKQKQLQAVTAMNLNQAEHQAWMAELAKLDWQMMANNELAWWGAKAGGTTGAATGAAGRLFGMGGKAAAGPSANAASRLFRKWFPKKMNGMPLLPK